MQNTIEAYNEIEQNLKYFLKIKQELLNLKNAMTQSKPDLISSILNDIETLLKQIPSATNLEKFFNDASDKNFLHKKSELIQVLHEIQTTINTTAVVINNGHAQISEIIRLLFKDNNSNFTYDKNSTKTSYSTHLIGKT